jgi:hypothetical protein
LSAGIPAASSRPRVCSDITTTASSGVSHFTQVSTSCALIRLWIIIRRDCSPRSVRSTRDVAPFGVKNRCSGHARRFGCIIDANTCALAMNPGE